MGICENLLKSIEIYYLLIMFYGIFIEIYQNLSIY